MSPKLARKFACCTTVLVGLLWATVLQADDDATIVAASPNMPRPMGLNQTRSASELAQRELLVRQVIRSAEERAKNQPGDSAAAKSLEQAQALLQRMLNANEPAAEPDTSKLEKAAFLGVATSPASVVLRRQLKLSEGIGLVVD
jgi:hypothetical protein